MGQGNDDEWSFKVDAPEETEEEVKERKRKKRGIPKEPLFNKKEKKLTVDDGGAPKRMSRSALADKEGGRAIKGRVPIGPAPFMRRAFAFFIDLVVLMGLTFIASAAAGGYTATVVETLKAYYIYDLVSFLGDTNLVAFVVSIPLHFLYMVLPLVVSKKTLGKNIVGIEVKGSDKPDYGFGKAIFRETIAKMISFGLILGFIWPLFNKKRRSLHDFIAGTVVLKVPK